MYQGWTLCNAEQGNYSLRRPPKLIILKAAIDQRRAAVCRFMFNQICTVLANSQKVQPARPQIWNLYV